MTFDEVKKAQEMLAGDGKSLVEASEGTFLILDPNQRGMTLEQVKTAIMQEEETVQVSLPFEQIEFLHNVAGFMCCESLGEAVAVLVDRAYCEAQSDIERGRENALAMFGPLTEEG